MKQVPPTPPGLPQRLQDAGSRLVRRVAAEDTPTAAALFDIVAGSRKDWTPPDWDVLLWDMDHSTLTVAEFCARFLQCESSA